jgi:hypothetical protein
MSEERRYGEDEVHEIFALAAESHGTAVSARPEPEGMTLAELQAVGLEVGLPPERVARAAASLDTRPEPLARRTLLGSPVSVGRIVDLPRGATDREWQFLVAELRETFGAKGDVTAHGDVREWSNGNLHAVLEETEAGHRLRLGTYKGNASEVLALGGVGILIALIMAVAMVAKAKTGIELILPAFFAAWGGGAIAANAIRLPKWANERDRQMDHVAGRARALLEAGPSRNNDETEVQG